MAGGHWTLISALLLLITLWEPEQAHEGSALLFAYLRLMGLLRLPPGDEQQ